MIYGSTMWVEARDAGVRPLYMSHNKTGRLYKVLGQCQMKSPTGAWLNAVRYTPLTGETAGHIFVRPIDMFKNFSWVTRRSLR